MDHRAYWIWLQHALGAGSTKGKRVLRYYGTLRRFYEAGEGAWARFGIFTQKELAAMRGFTLEHAGTQLEYCEKLGQEVLTPESANYPEGLRQIQAPPQVLYVKGALPDFDTVLAIAVVGSRDATESGRKTAYRMGYDLARAGAAVVSGGARGADIEAHKGALEAGGVTVCLLGCGISYPYLLENARTREKIAAAGALVSEYPPDTGVLPGNFPVRNRLIAGLCAGVCVVEGEKRSGTLITARHAADQGRDVFAVPGDANNPLAEGTNALIKEGAKPVTEAQDILEEYAGRVFRRAQAMPVHEEKRASKEDRPARGPAPGGLSEDAGRLYAGMGDTPAPIGALAEKTGLPTGRLFAAVTELELLGLCESRAGRQYVKK